MWKGARKFDHKTVPCLNHNFGREREPKWNRTSVRLLTGRAPYCWAASCSFLPSFIQSVGRSVCQLVGQSSLEASRHACHFLSTRLCYVCFKRNDVALTSKSCCCCFGGCCCCSSSSSQVTIDQTKVYDASMWYLMCFSFFLFFFFLN